MTEYTMKYEPPHFGALTTAESVMVNFHPTSEYVTFDQLREKLRKKPDLVEVVRCRDCKYGIDGGKYCAEGASDSWDWRNVEPDGFCAWASRRDGKVVGE